MPYGTGANSTRNLVATKIFGIPVIQHVFPDGKTVNCSNKSDDGRVLWRSVKQIHSYSMICIILTNLCKGDR